MKINGYTIIKGCEKGKTVFYAIAGDTALLFLTIDEAKRFCEAIPIDTATDLCKGI